MPEHDDSHPFIDTRTIIALAERLTRVETQQQSLVADTTVIRSTMHKINNDLQIAFGSNARREEILNQLLNLTKDLPAIASSAQSFTEMKVKLNDMLDTQQRRRGERGAVMLMGSLLVGAVSIGGGIIGGILWLIGVFHK